MLDYKLFERVTYDSNGKRTGYRIKEYQEYQEQMKQLVKEFNNFTINLINYFNEHSEQDDLISFGMTNLWQNSGYYNSYFWNKIIKGSKDYDGIAIWILLDANGLRISIGTTNTLESLKDNNFVNQVNQNIIQQCTLDIDGFEREVDGKYATYKYKRNEPSLEDFSEVLKYLYPIYENTLSTYKNKINELEFRRNYKEFVDTLPLQDMGKFARLYTDARNTPFKVYKNSLNSIVVKAFTDNASAMVITANQLAKVVFEGQRYLYASYEPILIDRIKNKNYIRNDEIMNENEIEEQYSPVKQYEPIVDHSIKNIILYGAPGVGKTYNHKKLIALIEGRDFDPNDIFRLIKTDDESEIEEGSIDDLYNNVISEQRMKFVTFHQSFGYEDFIEGFRPNNEGNIELEDGIFKTISDDARGKFHITDDHIMDREIYSERSRYIVKSITGDLINLTRDTDNRIVPIPKNLIIELLAYIEDSQIRLDDIKYRNLDHIKMTFDKYMYGYNSILYAICKNILERNVPAKNNTEEKNFYLVIDEINRGNISKIFGELITLIEEDKRDILEVTLPYSKKPFKIPANLYIIGTMNSTDKSIALIDIALRRRFTFIKMKPNSNLVPEVARNIFIQLNESITKKLGEDYQIGHSYFMNIQDENDLRFTLEYKVKPLLEEYFYGDEQGYMDITAIFDNSENIE